jgi:hypothetical protein
MVTRYSCPLLYIHAVASYIRAYMRECVYEGEHSICRRRQAPHTINRCYVRMHMSQGRFYPYRVDLTLRWCWYPERRVPLHASLSSRAPHVCPAYTHADIRTQIRAFLTPMCPTTTLSCEQTLSVELWASAAAIYCAPSAPIALSSRLYAYVCERNDKAHVRNSRFAILCTQQSASYPMRTHVNALHVPLHYAITACSS